MRFQLWVNIENDAFVEDPFAEFQRILQSAKRGLAYGQRECRLMDVNGNVVGMYVIDGR